MHKSLSHCVIESLGQAQQAQRTQRTQRTQQTQMIPKTEAIVLKSFDYRETSRIATFFTKDYGKISGILKGIRRDHKKFGSSIDRFSVNYLVYYHYRKTDLHLISQCDLMNYYYPIRQDYKRNLAANYSLELVDAIMPTGEVNHDIYQLMLDYLQALQDNKDVDKLVNLFQIKLLLFSGFSPHLDTCVKCGKKIFGKVRFSMISGGLICQKCPTMESSFSILAKGTVSTILHIEQGAWAQCLRIGLTPTVRRELKFILNNFLIYHLERNIKSAKYLMADK